jgi:hypothetical protein
MTPLLILKRYGGGPDRAMAKVEHPLSTPLQAPTNPRARAASRLDQPVPAQELERAHDRRPADAEFLGESALRRQTRTRPEAATDDSSTQFVRNLRLARAHS